MTRVLLATLGSLGDLHPCIALGRALRDRGLRVRVATSMEYRSRIEVAGLEFAPLAPALAELGEPARLARDFFHPVFGPRRLFQRLVIDPLPRARADLEAAAAGVDLVITHPLTAVLPFIAEQRGVPWVATVLAPFGLFSVDDPVVLPAAQWLHRLPRIGNWPHGTALSLARRTLRSWEAPLHALRAQMGLPPRAGSLLLEAQFSPLLNLALFDAELAQRQADWPAHTVVCGAPLHDAAAPETALDAAIDAGLEDFLAAGNPPIVFALGSAAVWIAGDFWRQAIAACEALGRRGILLTGTPIALELPAGVRAYDYLPYSRVFPRAAAIVHQGGIGTLSQALRAGRPQLITPAGFDQPDNAARAARLGVARILPLARARDRGRLRTSLQELLADTGYVDRATAIATLLRGRNGAARAAEAVLQLLVAR